MTHAYAHPGWRRWLAFSLEDEPIPAPRRRHAGRCGEGPGHHGRRPGRRRRGDVRTALLLLLEEEPRNGYGLMQAIEERSGGAWRPSPGSVYPTLAQLEDEGLVRSVEGESGRVFELTGAGRERVAERRPERAPWEPGTEPGGDIRRELFHQGKGILLAVRQVVQAGDPAQLERAREILSEARRALYLVLAGEQES